LPHGGDVAALKSWWSRWNDPVLVGLIEAAQATNPGLEQAAARIAQARAVQAVTASTALPGVTANSSVTRSNSGVAANGPVASSAVNASLQAAWELDLFGANRRTREAADARFTARNIDWHQARVSLAAEVATVYVSLRVNEALLTGFERDAASRSETARLTGLKADAGFEAPANAALANASASEARARLTEQRAQLDLDIKALVALTGMTEAALRNTLVSDSIKLPAPASFAVNAIPAGALAQRPDLAAAERELAALIAEIGVAEADRYPRISLTGSVGYSVTRVAGMTSDGATWGFGPSITLPLFDAGRRLANVDLARARYAEALAGYKAVAIRAVREVEEALTQLQAAQARLPQLGAALEGYVAFEKAAQARLSVGAGSVLELEDARRAVLAAQVAMLTLERERANAWISLYRAAGGGWDVSQTQALLQVSEIRQ
jgi:NodT family efflux transporter outer membrane factor (OMF) lipoprotein